MESAEGIVPEGDKVPTGVFVLPPCYLNRDLFNGESSFNVHEKERKVILSEDKEVRRKNLAEDVAAVMGVLETSLSLNDEAASSHASLDAAYAKIQKLKAKNEKLKCDILNHESRFEAQVRLLKDLNELRPQLEAATKENDRLVARTKELEGITAPDEDETDAEKGMASRAEFITRIQVLEQDVIDTLGYGFNTVVEQLKILNPGVEMVVEGAGLFNQVINGKYFYPPDSSDGEDEA